MARLSVRSLYPIVLFVIVVLFVAAVVIGVIFFASQRGEQVRRSAAQEIAAQQDREQAEERPTTGGSSPEVETPVSPAPVEEVPAETDSGEELPVTGPAEVFSGILAVAALSLAISYYVASRHAVRNS